MFEDGLNSGARNFGRLCLSMIPWMLGLGAAAWLGVWGGLHTYRHQLAMEARAARYVGSAIPSQSPIIIKVLERDCIRITRADVDGDQLLVYAKNSCHKEIHYTEYHWQELSPDNTALHEGYDNGVSCAIPSQPEDAAECRFRIPIDERTTILRVWMERSD